MISLFTQTQQGALAAMFFVAGLVAGRLANLWSMRMARSAAAESATVASSQESGPLETESDRVGLRDSIDSAATVPITKARLRELEPASAFGEIARSDSPAPAAPSVAVPPSVELGHGITLWPGIVEVATGLLFAGFVLAYVRFHCQQTPEVRPDDYWLYARVFYQLILIWLLVVATATDLREFVIPDQITIPGVLIGLLGATISGQFQIIHLWVDWNQEIPGITGPYIPEWLDPHRHLHGLAWSLAGGLCGAGLTWLVRFCSSRILGREALGFGDVTLMGLIGTYLGWQPTVFAFLAAPLCGLALLIPVKVLWQRPHVPYGPFLAAGTIVVLLSWKWLWLSSRLVFGDARSLGLLAGGSLVAFLALLCLLRIFQAWRDPLHANRD
jgi:leader peptidase (prepilin peptidase)/N-methyltransferase